MAGDRPGAVEGAGEIGVEDGAPLVVGYVPDRLAPLAAYHARVVDEDIDAAELAHRRFDEALHLGRVGDVRRLGERPGADGPDLAGDAFERLRPAAGEYDVAAGAGQGQRHLPAEAGASSGDDGNGAFEAEGLKHGFDHAGMIMPEGRDAVVLRMPDFMWRRYVSPADVPAQT